MFVKYSMTSNPICITKETPLSEAANIMNANNFHRIPVTEDGKVIGLVTSSTISDNMPSKATSLSRHEVTYLLNSIKCGDVMVKNVVTISPDLYLEDAAYMMLKNNIRCLPVVVNDKIVGIITDKDILSAYVDIMGYYEEGCKVVVEVEEDKVGIIAAISRLLADADVSISHFAVYHIDKVEVLINFHDKDIDKVVNILTTNGYKVVATKTRNLLYK